MAKRLTRRSISVMGKTYHRLKAKCALEGKSVSGFLEELIAPHIEGVELPTVIEQPKKPQPQPEPDPEDSASGIFTF